MRGHERGDSVADSLLAEKGPLAVYKLAEEKKLASALGMRLDPPLSIDASRSHRGGLLQRRWLAEIMAAGIGAVVESVGYVPGNEIVGCTGQLAGAPCAKRRLLETGQFVVDAICKGLQPDSEALETIASVRMLHAMVRRHVRERGVWDEKERGVPVSQFDCLSTLRFNSFATLRTLEYMGVRLDEHDKTDVSLFWSHVGWLLGIDAELLPASYAEEAHQYALVRRDFFRPQSTPVAARLAEGVIEGASNLPPFFFSNHFTRSRAWNFLGDELATAFGLPTPPLAHRVALVAMGLLPKMRQLYDDWIGLDEEYGVAYVRSILESELKKTGGPANFHFRLTAKENRLAFS